MRPYSPRRIRSHGLRRHRGWRLKVYSITHDGSDLDWPAFESGLGLAMNALPEPAHTEQRPGVGLVIVHAGRGADYVVLGWWDRENELPLRVFVRSSGDPAGWRAAEGSESVCVWDLQVIGFERDAYVSTVLSVDRTGDVTSYLGRYLPHEPAGP